MHLSISHDRSIMYSGGNILFEWHANKPKTTTTTNNSEPMSQSDERKIASVSDRVFVPTGEYVVLFSRFKDVAATLRVSCSNCSIRDLFQTFCISVWHSYYNIFIFIISWICIHQIRYPWRACSFALRLMPYLLGLFHWGVCRTSKFGAFSKRKSCKIDWILDAKCMLCHVLCFPYKIVSVCTRTHCTRALSLYRNPPKQNFMLNFK